MSQNGDALSKLGYFLFLQTENAEAQRQLTQKLADEVMKNARALVELEDKLKRLLTMDSPRVRPKITMIQEEITTRVFNQREMPRHYENDLVELEQEAEDIALKIRQAELEEARAARAASKTPEVAASRAASRAVPKALAPKAAPRAVPEVAASRAASRAVSEAPAPKAASKTPEVHRDEEDEEDEEDEDEEDEEDAEDEEDEEDAEDAKDAKDAEDEDMEAYYKAQLNKRMNVRFQCKSCKAYNFIHPDGRNHIITVVRPGPGDSCYAGSCFKCRTDFWLEIPEGFFEDFVNDFGRLRE